MRFLNGYKTGSVSVKALTKRVACDQIIMYVVLCQFVLVHSMLITVQGTYWCMSSSSSCTHLRTHSRPPLVQLAIFLGSMGLMEGRDRNHIREKYRDLYKPLLITNWQVWPIAQVSPLPYHICPFTECDCKPLAHKFPLHASAIPSTISIYMWGILDPLSIHCKFKVCTISHIGLPLLLRASIREAEKQDHRDAMERTLH